MGTMPRHDEFGREDGLRQLEDSPAVPAPEVRNRQAAASYLQASTLAGDVVTRESLRRRAAALLAPGHGGPRECAAC